MGQPEPKVQLEIGSRVENIELVQVAVEASLNQLRVDEDASHDIGIAVREAVANAIRHGNQQNPEKKVGIEFAVEGEDVVISVTDQGTGFDLDALEDPRAPANLLKPSGRGIFFMDRFMDAIDYTFLPEGGTVVTMRKHVGALVGEALQEDEA